MITNKMNPDVKKLWVEALRSGEFQQGQCILRNKDKNTFCCLGVLCELAVRQGIVSEYAYDIPLPDDPKILDWAGLSDKNPEVTIFNTEELEEEANGVAAHNDHGYDFLAIAEVIEAQL